jgi:hypothetical protein
MLEGAFNESIVTIPDDDISDIEDDPFKENE